MNALRLFSLSLLLIMGCHDSSVPLGPPDNAPTIPSITGTWEPLDMEEEEGDVLMKIMQFNDHEYYIEFTCYETEDDNPETMHIRAYITPLGDRLFANVQAIDEEMDDRDYMIFWFELTNDDLISTVMIDEDMSHIKTSEELVSFVSELIENDYLEQEEIMQYRRLAVEVD